MSGASPRFCDCHPHLSFFFLPSRKHPNFRTSSPPTTDSYTPAIFPGICPSGLPHHIHHSFIHITDLETKSTEIQLALPTSPTNYPFHNNDDQKHHQHVCLPASLLPVRRHARHQLSLHPLPAHPVHRLHLNMQSDMAALSSFISQGHQQIADNRVL